MHSRDKRHALSDWAKVTGAAAVTMSCIDALLLQESRGLFTGGFLADDYLRSPLDVASFAAMSLTTDAGVCGLLAAVALYLVSLRPVTRATSVVAGLMAATIPMLVIDVVNYQLLRYLGASFDLDLMFDLTGRSVPEILAVAGSHLLLPAVLIAGTGLGACGLLWFVNRAVPSEVAPRMPARALVIPIAVAIVATAGVTLAVAASEVLSNALPRKPSGRCVQLLVSQLSDFDRDGFGVIGRVRDPHPFDAAIFPYATDIPGNGIDEDDVAGDLPVDAAGYPETPMSAQPWARKPDVVLIVLESFRADLINAKLNGQPITPVMNDLAKHGLSVSQAYSHNGYTVQSRFHLMAGTFVARPGTRTLVDDFKAQGYVVGYFSGQDESFGARDYRVGFDRADVAYDARADVGRRYSTFTTPGSLAVSHIAVHERVEEFARTRRGDARPWFVYVSFEDTHFPYVHDDIEPLVSQVRLSRNQIAPRRREELFAMYANTAANVDRAVGKLLESIHTARGHEPAVVITADHGESLFDEGFLGHGYGLNDVQTQVPLIVANVSMKIPTPFSHVDLRPTLVAALQDPAAGQTPRSLATTRPVFQYLGDLTRPRQIAFLREGQRLIYDFRMRRVQTWEGEWVSISSLADGQAEDFRRLVRQWELMNLARHAERTRSE